MPRADVAAVEILRAAAGIKFSDRSIVVVGTNGKTSTATFIERILRFVGVRTGLTTSPHIHAWGERITINGEAITDERLLAELERLHRLAPTVTDIASLRFFDLVTLAAAALFAEEQVEVAIYEAGIGGRLDATHLVAAPLAVLTSIGIDHEELLGERELDALREKLGVARRGATVVSAELPAVLRHEAEAIAAREGLDLRIVDDVTGAFLSRNASLALRALRDAPFTVGVIPDDVTSALAGGVRGRMQRIRAHGVEVILDAAHNPQGWSELSALLPPRYVAVVSIARTRSAEALAASLAQAHRVFVTQAWPDRSYDAVDLGSILTRAGLEADAVSEPARAFDAALRLAKSEELPLVVYGSTYLLPHAFAALDG
ncbi:MAG: bifunctional folylpolyglutamate synthase/dihydrofolate synthase [Gaiellaceae bacterium]